ncbi:hypothetical protein HO173_001003 [Letharia columbiana]|uniref:ubiquitinyl hydrolase 1 n=1 Tax=Letharia columbiana TaxID=112416 RepID=A0A8H6G5Z4_9LECA|nr:uncharacterized protein HO173_001003 [Letharia columbiana]KAF6241209.1 hypothetical protein HO173_001003 [Letharia columbiana]
MTPTAYNILTSLPYFDEEEPEDLPLLPPGKSCKHKWSLKKNQSNLPGDGYKPDSSTVWKIALYCSVCRSHLDLLIDFQEGSAFSSPCPTSSRPLHHFIHRPGLSKPRQHGFLAPDPDTGFPWVDEQHFQCSAVECSAKLVIWFKPPRLVPDWVKQLTDKFMIKTRAEKAMAEDPKRFEGHAVPLPINVLSNLRVYIWNAVQTPEKSRKIPGHNKQFLLSLGESCADLLEYIGFTREGEDWLPPEPEVPSPDYLSNSLNVRLDDLLRELYVLIFERPDDERITMNYQYIPEWAKKDLSAVLGCLDFRQSTRSRTVDLTEAKEEHPWHAGLGATADFHDELIEFSYERQLEIDPYNTPYYLECLQGIARGRHSETLHTKVAIEASENRISLKDVRAAFKELGLDSRSDYEDDTIIGTFQSRVSDAPKQETEMRRALKIIGQSRRSEKIEFVASQAVTNYEQALLYLEASADFTDDFIVSMYTVKIDQPSSEESIARHAVALIADHRKSNALKHWLETGALGEVEMDVGQAYVRLDISDRTLDDEIILAQYESLIADSPSQVGDLKNALAAIAKAKNSRRLKGFLNLDMNSSEHPISEWPVGLENIGNTCYLNSLLQFYFTIKPLRDLVLKIKEFKMPTDGESLKSKRVGSRNVSKKEVDRAQQFVDQLKKLFEDMIASSKASVTPEPELARLTLVSSSKEEHIRRQSMLSPTRPSLGQINGSPVFGPLGPPSLSQKDTEMSDEAPLEAKDSNAVNNDPSGDDASDITLVDGPSATEDDVMILDDDDGEKGVQQKFFEDKENMPPTKESVRETSPETYLRPLGESSPSRVNEQQGSLNLSNGMESEPQDFNNENSKSSETGQGDSGDEKKSIPAAPPNRPPPVPPRPKPIETNAVQEAEYGAQQDVTEVITNVLFQLQCAIKAESVDESGEQIDQVKRLFFGKQKSYTTNRQGRIRTKEEYMSDIKVDVATGSRDIYAALDGAYDVQEVEVRGDIEPQYTSISQLPPILQVHVQRVQFDMVKKSVFKSNHHLELKETIYMDRYMDSSDADLMQRRRECWEWKKQLTKLESRRVELATSDMGMDMPEILEATSDFLRQIPDLDDKDPIEVPPGLLQVLDNAATEAKVELESLDLQIRDLKSHIASQFNDLQKLPYRLQSVFIHRGFHNSGHYWIYIYDFTRQLWRNYNDGYVTEIKDTKEIFEQEPGDRPATPYFLVYVKDESKEDLVDSVCRDVVEPPAEEQQDTVMEDYSQAQESQTDGNTYRPVNSSMDYGTVESYNSQGWTRGEGWVDSSPWNQKEAQVYSNW